MSNLEIIDLLCKVVEQQAKIIRNQAVFIEEQNTVDEETKKSFAEQRSEVDAEINLIQESVGLIIDVPQQKGEENGIC